MSVLLSTRELALHVGGLDILTDVSLELRAGETLGLIGPMAQVKPRCST